MLTVDEANEAIRIDVVLTHDEYHDLLRMCGCAAANAETERLKWRYVHLANKLNEGNPQWRPYRLPANA